MWYKKVKHEAGRFVDAEGNKYILVQCHKAMGKDGKKNEELGLTEFETLNDCLTAWGLTENKVEHARREEKEI